MTDMREPDSKPEAGRRQPAPAIPAPPAKIAAAPAAAVAPKAAKAESSPNFDLMSQNMARLVEGAGKVAQAYLKPVEEGRAALGMANEAADAVKTIGHIAEHWLADPARAIEAQQRLSSSFLSLWSHTLRRMSGETVAPLANIDPADRRFADPLWRESPYYDFIAQAYAITANWADSMVREAEGVDAHTRDKAQFYVRQIASAVAPSNFIATSPSLLHETLHQNGANLVRGVELLAQDIESGHGRLKIRQSDNSKFELGVNMATTPGKVIFRNDLIELLQYAPTTPQVLKRPLLIIPPWINKYYILDLNPEKSFIRWAVGQGLTVFVVSWVNPDQRHAGKDFADYMREGIFAALDAMHAATGERRVSAIGYCVGGTLLSVALAHMAAQGDDRIAHATLFTTQVDFTDPGDLKVFVDEEQIRDTEAEMAKAGYLDGGKMANAFNMLRPDDLIWSYVVNNYVKGEAPKPFDLLTWNSDSTRMPAANHSFYLRQCYLQNSLTKGEMTVDGVRLDLRKVTIPIYNLATREDHIAPAASVFRGAQFFGGPMRFVLSGSGHIAGVVNPPGKVKYQYWLGPAPKGDLADWMGHASETPGSWWPDWIEWTKAQAPEMVKARIPGDGKLAPLGDAPGEYVRVKA